MTRLATPIAITRSEADATALAAAEGQEGRHKALVELKNRGLYRWSPEPWNAHVSDTNRDYFYWAYEAVYGYEDLGTTSDMDSSNWFIVGTEPKGGADVTPGTANPDIEAEDWDEDCDAMFARMRKATPDDLKEFGMADLEVLVIFSR